MSEILRAVLDASCVDTRPAFYTVTMRQPTLGAQQIVNLSGILQCKSDRWFLMTSAQMFSVGGSPRYINFFQFQTFDLRSLTQTKSYFSDSQNMLHGNMGDNAMNPMTFPEYILWEPNSLIGINCRSFAFNSEYHNYIVLTGIEYAR